MGDVVVAVVAAAVAWPLFVVDGTLLQCCNNWPWQPQLLDRSSVEEEACSCSAWSVASSSYHCSPA